MDFGQSSICLFGVEKRYGKKLTETIITIYAAIGMVAGNRAG